MDLHVYNTLILSDLHLGAETSHAREATRVLKENRFQRLILLGDIFADLNFARLTKEHWKFLGYIRKLSNPKRNIEVVWVEGNHDHGLTNIMSHLVGVRVYQRYAWQYDGLQHIAIHGAVGGASDHTHESSPAFAGQASDLFWLGDRMTRTASPHPSSSQNSGGRPRAEKRSSV